MIELIVRDSDFATFVGSGVLTANEILTDYSRFLRTEPTRLVLWDLTQARLSDMGLGDVRILAHEAVEAGRARRPHGRSAILCGRPADYEVARTLLEYLESEAYTVQTAVFMDRTLALAWLAGGEDDD